jgi:hypothetical protein
MRQNRSDKYFSFANLMSIGTLSIAVLLILTIREAASPTAIIIVIAIVCGVGLAVGALLAELVATQSRRETASSAHSRKTDV